MVIAGLCWISCLGMGKGGLRKLLGLPDQLIEGNIPLTTLCAPQVLGKSICVMSFDATYSIANKYCKTQEPRSYN